MGVLTWLLRIFLFVILLGLAIKNSGDVVLHFYFDTNWTSPLSIVLLATFGLGVVLGSLALLPRLIRQKRDLARLQRQVDRQAASAAKEPPVEAA
jgi:uncharacterized integral membrane protein